MTIHKELETQFQKKKKKELKDKDRITRKV